MRDSKAKGSVQLRPRKSGKVVKGAGSGSEGKSRGRKQTPPSTGRQRKSKETSRQPAQTKKVAVRSKDEGRQRAGVRAAASGHSRSKGAGQQAKTVAVKDLKQASRRNKQNTKGRKEAAPTKKARNVKVELAKQKKAGERKTLVKQRQKKSATKSSTKTETEKEAQKATVS
ncbi:uncharacterized protein [Diadema antillarum]|uniref:uncharacterized protein n=1 Tax=Diadema antillarum TaxID=105358 RepID=UPI003A8BF390